jgi:hypothetical protein
MLVPTIDRVGLDAGPVHIDAAVGPAPRYAAPEAKLSSSTWRRRQRPSRDERRVSAVEALQHFPLILLRPVVRCGGSGKHTWTQCLK